MCSAFPQTRAQSTLVVITKVASAASVTQHPRSWSPRVSDTRKHLFLFIFLFESIIFQNLAICFIFGLQKRVLFRGQIKWLPIHLRQDMHINSFNILCDPNSLSYLQSPFHFLPSTTLSRRPDITTKLYTNILYEIRLKFIFGTRLFTVEQILRKHPKNVLPFFHQT